MSVVFRIMEKNLSVQCFRNLNLLAHAQTEEINVGSQCGGHGKCGGDRVLIIQGADRLSSLTELEKKHLSPEEICAGVRLACQAWPEDDNITIVSQILSAIDE